MAKKFQLQKRSAPKRTCRIDIDDRSTCCECEVVYFERDYDDRSLGGYEGCEYCGAMVPKKRKKRQPTPMMFD